MRRVLVLAVGLLVVGCAPRNIPGTSIEDTSDTRAVLDLMERYRKAVEQRNAQGLIELADESFKDDGGSVSPEDDLTFETLYTELPARLLKLSDVKLDLTVRRIEFADDRRRARVTYSYQMSFKLPQYSTRSITENDLKQMALRRVDENRWKIVSGI